MYQNIPPPNENTGPLTSFVSIYTNKKTISNYISAVTHYLSCFNPSINTTNEADIYAEKYLQSLKENNNKIHHLKYAGNLFVKKYSPTTARLYLTISCIWLEDNGISLTCRERRHVFAAMPPPLPSREEIDMDKETFRKIYNHLPKWTQALMLVLLGSGMRIGEAMTATKKDIEWKGKYTSINISSEKTKTKKSRTVYITSEASEELKNYLTSRIDEDERIFPYTVAAAQYQLRKAVDALHLTNSKRNGNQKIRLIHWHMTRKWFISRFTLAANKQIAEHLAGHEGYLDSAYFRCSKKDITSEYAKAEKYLSIL